MKKLIIFFAFLFSLAANSQTLNSKIADGRNYTNVNITANGVKAITGPILNTDLNKIFDLFKYIDTANRFATVHLIPGTNITISGTYPNYTITSTAEGGAGSGDSSTFKVFASESALRASTFDHTTGTLEAQLLNGKNYYLDRTSTATDDGLFVIDPATGGAGRWLKIFTGTVRGTEANILTNGSNQTSGLNTLFANATVKEVLLDVGNTTITSSVDLQGKILKIENGARVTGAGTVTNGYIEAAKDQRVLDTTLTVTSLKNTEISLGWWIVGDSSVNNTRAIQRAVAACNSIGRNFTLYIPKPIGYYTYGRQEFPSLKASESYSHDSLFYIHDCHDFQIIGNDAKFKLASGLHYGTFNRTTGDSVYHTPPYFNSANDRAQIGTLMVLENCYNGEVSGIYQDGNLQNLVIGGPYDDLGIQLEAGGIKLVNDSNVNVHDGAFLYNGQDGGIGSSIVTSIQEKDKPIYFKNVLFNGNGRQGFSMVSGKGWNFDHCEFSNTGRTVNTHTTAGFISAPGAGFDNEAEGGNITYNIFLNNCKAINNYGQGVLTGASANSLGMTLNGGLYIGTTAYSLWPRSPNFRANNITSVGAVNGAWEATSPSDPERSIFDHCTFSFDTTLSPTKQVYLTFVDLGGLGAHAEFLHCIFPGGQHGLNPYAANDIHFESCTFLQGSAATLLSHTSGTFTGKNVFTGAVNNDFGSAHILGEVWVNDSLYAQSAPHFDSGLLVRNNNSSTVSNTTWKWLYSTTHFTPKRVADIMWNLFSFDGSPIGYVWDGSVKQPFGYIGASSNPALKVNISDTASMLSPYLRKVDTSSLSSRINLKLTITDTTNKWVTAVTKNAGGDSFYVYKGTTHTALIDNNTGGGGTVTDKQTFTATASQTAFTVTGLPASENDFDIYINGGYVNPSYYSVSGTTLTFSSGLDLNDNMEYARKK